ncbi:MAG: hypothetical protein E7588_03265 [Ruminococcaceae bacterium]|nr:hypothetical protein [Oscillospiraceae bacterium]
MEIFGLTLNQMLLMFTFIVLGIVLRKSNILPSNAYVTMSRLETYIFVPALSLHNQMTNCTVETFKENSKLILYGAVVVAVAVAAAYPLSALFVRRHRESAELAYQRNIYKYALTFGNYGFMGNFIVLGVWGSEMFFKYSMFTLIVGIICSSWGLYILIPKEQNAGVIKNIMKGFLAPPMLALVVGVAFGLLNLKRFVPEFLLTAFSNAGSCMGPVAMVLAGVVIGGYEFKSLFVNKKVYIVTAARLIVIPAVIVSILKLLGTNDEIVSLALVAFATPLGMNTIVYPAAYGGDTKTGAAMTMISHTLAVITIPLMYLLFVVVL